MFRELGCFSGLVLGLLWSVQAPSKSLHNKEKQQQTKQNKNHTKQISILQQRGGMICQDLMRGMLKEDIRPQP